MSGQRARLAKLRKQLDGKFRNLVNEDRTHCYCGALDLEYPHYLAEHTDEHTDEHDAARELRARRAEGTR